MRKNHDAGTGSSASVRTTGIKNMRLVAILLLSMLLSACAGSSKPAQSSPGNGLQTEVRDAASRESAGIQVQPLQNPAVRQLLASAQASESAGQLEQASQMLERALRIEPRDPEVLQRLAEIRLQQQDWQQAINFATRSYDVGSQVGEMCARNWHTIALANNHGGDTQAASAARSQVEHCMPKRPQKH